MENTDPVGNSEILELRADGDFACGSGTLTSSGVPNRFSFIDGIQGGDQWELDWSVTFSEGIGQVTGTATNSDTGETRGLGGTIFIEDGAAAGQCDDAADAQNVVVRLVLQ